MYTSYWIPSFFICEMGQINTILKNLFWRSNELLFAKLSCKLQWVTPIHILLRVGRTARNEDEVPTYLCWWQCLDVRVRLILCFIFISICVSIIATSNVMSSPDLQLYPLHWHSVHLEGENRVLFILLLLLLLFFSCQVMPDSLWLHGLQHSTTLCSSLSPRVCPSSCPLKQWCHPAISFSVTLFSFCLDSFPASGLFQWVSS